MRKIYILLFLLVWRLPLAFSADVAGLRKLYYEATTDRNSADRFMQLMQEIPAGSDPLLLCYKGMAHLLLANYSFNPRTKLSFFSKGKAMLEKALSTDPQNIEIRFMRFCVQANAPFFLGYNRDLNKDKAVILNGWNEIKDPDLKLKIRNYLLECSACTEAEKSILK
jgi:hypothetical protein